MNTKNKKIMTIGVSGDKGSFSEEAAINYYEKSGEKIKINYCIDMEGVLSSLKSGIINKGIFPVVNLTGGLVLQAFDAMGKYEFKMIDEIALDVKQCLLVKNNITKADVKTIVSHSQALAQCKEYLKKEFAKAKLIEYEDTAKAAHDLGKNFLDKTTAVIAPRRCAEMYELQILDKDIQDISPNLTIFIVVEKYQ